MIKNVKYKNVYDGKETLCDITTGEIKLCTKFKRIIVNSGFYQVYTKKGEYMVLPKEFTITDRQVLDYLCIMMDKDNFSIAPVIEVAERLSLSTKSIYRSFANLSKADYIRRRAPSVFMVNPEYSTKTKGDLKEGLFATYASLFTGKDNEVSGD